ncbi:MAG TPA: AbrB/MazE/SpoVT family DNA-binding domain-containing protein [Candidatus Acidoferrum sp.]|nr:AbrB/MazE/SpoVT family DNA-binding domain-containing protein [Candidatus Acidoferrum sp.]
MAEATLSSKNQIVIPREARKRMGLKPGDKLLVVMKGEDMIVLRKPKSYRTAITGIGRGLYSTDYLKKERESWE